MIYPGSKLHFTHWVNLGQSVISTRGSPWFWCVVLHHCTMCTLYSTIPQCPMYPNVWHCKLYLCMTMGYVFRKNQKDAFTCNRKSWDKYLLKDISKYSLVGCEVNIPKEHIVHCSVRRGAKISTRPVLRLFWHNFFLIPVPIPSTLLIQQLTI